MKTLTLLLICFLATNLSFAQTNKKVIKTRFLGKKVAATLICTPNKFSPEEADAQTIMKINELLMAAEKEAKLLDVSLLLSKEPTKKNIFVFGIESEKSLKLFIEMYDEEGFSMVLDCDFEIKTGKNFLAINIKNIENGSYHVRIKDEEGAEVNRVITISKK